MMRANAPIPALLALAALYLFPANTLAAPAHHRVRKTAPAAPAHPKQVARTSRTVKHNASATSTHKQNVSTHHHVHRATSSSNVVNVLRTNTQRPHLASTEETAATPVILPNLYNRRGRLIVPPPLKGSHEILVHQNLVADRDGLDRIQNDDDLLDMRRDNLLVSLPSDNALQIDERLPLNRRYCRPWTAQFLITLARAHYAHFHAPLQINSAVRTVEFQQHLIHINGNAAPADGDTASPHLTGQAIDIAKHGLSLTEIAWLRAYLLPLVQEGKVDVEEEFQQSCFHISVYKKYLPPMSVPGNDLIVPHRNSTTGLATALR
jgi:Family of unknown function (DUF5715)